MMFKIKMLKQLKRVFLITTADYHSIKNYKIKPNSLFHREVGSSGVNPNYLKSDS